MRRVVVTGIGMVTPLAWGTEKTWAAILAGKSGAGRITTFDATDYACQVACEVPRVDGRGGGGPDIDGSFDPEKVMSGRERRRIDDFVLYAVAAADEALKDANWLPHEEAEVNMRLFADRVLPILQRHAIVRVPLAGTVG